MPVERSEVVMERIKQNWPSDIRLPEVRFGMPMEPVLWAATFDDDLYARAKAALAALANDQILFPARAQHEIWGSNPDATLCGSYAPACFAVAERDGYRLEGRWQTMQATPNCVPVIGCTRISFSR